MRSISDAFDTVNARQREHRTGERLTHTYAAAISDPFITEYGAMPLHRCMYSLSPFASSFRSFKPSFAKTVGALCNLDWAGNGAQQQPVQAARNDLTSLTPSDK